MKTFIHPLTIAMMAAGNFIQGYTPDDLKCERFSTCFDAYFDGRKSEIDYSIYFDRKGKAVKLDVDVCFDDGDGANWDGDYKSCMNKGVNVINEFTATYRAKTVFPKREASVFDDYKHDIYYKNKYREGVH